jgi:hypothetical protein
MGERDAAAHQHGFHTEQGKPTPRPTLSRALIPSPFPLNSPHLDAEEDFGREEAHGLFGEAPGRAEQILLQVAARREVEHDVDVPLVVERLLQPRDEGVVDTREDVALVHDHAGSVA